MVLSVAVAFSLPESPYWLAYKGNFEKCEKNFIWLRGSDAASKKELRELPHGAWEQTNSFGVKSYRHFWLNILCKDFYKPALYICILQFLIYGSGSIVTLIYPIVMLKKLTCNDNISSFGGFIMNALLCLGMCISIIMDKFFNKKNVLLGSVLCAVSCMLTGSVFFYLQNIRLWPSESLVGLCCLSGFMLFSSVGIVGSPYSIAAALMPVKNRGLGRALILINTGLFHTMTLKSAPYMFLYLDMWGTYLVYSCVSICCGLFIWRYVPETKGRSLQEIENFYNYGTYTKIEEFEVDSMGMMCNKDFEIEVDDA